MKRKADDALPTRAVVAELSKFRKVARASIDAHRRRVEAELDAVRKKLEALAGSDKTPDARGRDLRDMLTLLRSHKIDPAKGRRKDLKKIESLAEDLSMLCERW
jgi:hypothetical protein